MILIYYNITQNKGNLSVILYYLTYFNEKYDHFRYNLLNYV